MVGFSLTSCCHCLTLSAPNGIPLDPVRPPPGGSWRPQSSGCAVMIPLPILDSHAPPVRVMALHALAYCQRLFYLEEVEEIRVADARVFAGRELHASLAAEDDGELVSMELASETLGLMGKVDCLKRRDGSYIPYEHKRGQPARTPEG